MNLRYDRHGALGSLGGNNFRAPHVYGGNMKTNYTAVISAVVLAAAATLFVVEKRVATATPKVIHLKSNGATIAELKLPKGTAFEFTGVEQIHDKTTGRITAKGGVMIQIKHAGGSPVTVKADEIVISDAQ